MNLVNFAAQFRDLGLTSAFDPAAARAFGVWRSAFRILPCSHSVIQARDPPAARQAHAPFNSGSAVRDDFGSRDPCRRQQPTGSIQARGIVFANDPNVGIYSPRGGSTVVAADQFGGAGGTGNYLTDNSSFHPIPGTVSTTIIFLHPERYFGLWWSADDG